MKAYAVVIALFTLLASFSLLVNIRHKALAQDKQLAVTNSRMQKSTGYGEYLIVDAYVENLTDQIARNVTVKLIILDPTGITSFDGSNMARVYGTFTASIPEILPRSARWVTINTTVANAQDINDARKSFTIELVPYDKPTTVKAELQCQFEATAASFSN